MSVTHFPNPTVGQFCALAMCLNILSLSGVIPTLSPAHNTLCSCTSSWCGSPVVALACLHISPISASCRTSFFVVFWVFPEAEQQLFFHHRGVAGTLACKCSSSVQEEITADHCWVSSSSWMRCCTGDGLSENFLHPIILLPLPHALL